MKGLIIKSPWIELILAGKKVWEIRGSNTTIRGLVALIKSGTGTIVGEVTIVDSRKLSLKSIKRPFLISIL
ncbi:hypothetical protein GCM10011391_24670 [Pullulanibacillus camelliae]|uniref:ASCH domain-containing protein n=1 Tax=Pullulanibacillus camelliae TaxID=1707096 RepID=A0A8J2YIF9_9BACL|nr:ASCH domain-containing protein [Pullulanibacillus camelliae]GGE44896.1 hypothetical protein GCM10011391_24670 [Pullulanibacillus camelliae]